MRLCKLISPSRCTSSASVTFLLRESMSMITSPRSFRRIAAPSFSNTFTESTFRRPTARTCFWSPWLSFAIGISIFFPSARRSVTTPSANERSSALTVYFPDLEVQVRRFAPSAACVEQNHVRRQEMTTKCRVMVAPQSQLFHNLNRGVPHRTRNQSYHQHSSQQTFRHAFRSVFGQLYPEHSATIAFHSPPTPEHTTWYNLL